MALDVDGILRSIGVDVLRESGDELLGRCPMHVVRTGKADLHPSWSINTTTLVHHCFSCGYSGTLGSLYRDLGEKAPDDLEWELKVQSMVTSQEKLQAEPVETVPTGPAVNEWVLGNYADVPERLMVRRFLKRQALDDHQIRWDKDKRAWVLPIRAPKGELLGFQFRQKGVELNYPDGVSKSSTLFGMHLYTGVDCRVDRIAIVESPLDAVRLYGLGIDAVSSFGAHVSAIQIDLLARYFTDVVLAMDNDSVGRNANQILTRALKGRCNVYPFAYRGLSAKDPGDVQSDQDLLDAWNRSIHPRFDREHIL